jgi:hypothetical protein
MQGAEEICSLEFCFCGLFNDDVSSSDYTALNDRMVNE